MPLVKCPMCGKMIEYDGNEFRPFCSERCKLLDFGAWADESYNLPAEHTEMTEQDIAAIEQEADQPQLRILLKQQFGVQLVGPVGFENAYALAMRSDAAAAQALRGPVRNMRGG